MEVRLILDGIGSGLSLDNSDVKMMREAGCKFAYYQPGCLVANGSHQSPLASPRAGGGWTSWITGGAGFADRWAGHAQDKDHWHDVQVKVEGPLVSALQNAFEEHSIRPSVKP